GFPSRSLAFSPSCNVIGVSFNAFARAAGSVSSARTNAAGAVNRPTAARNIVNRSIVNVMSDPSVRDPGCGSRTQLAVDARDVRPVDGCHEGIDIGGRLGAVIDVIGTLVHIERQDRAPAGERRRVVHRPLVDELVVARRPGQQYPSRAAALG